MLLNTSNTTLLLQRILSSSSHHHSTLSILAAGGAAPLWPKLHFYLITILTSLPSLYAISIQAFLAGWHECSWTLLFKIILTCLIHSLIGISLSILGVLYLLLLVKEVDYGSNTTTTTIPIISTSPWFYYWSIPSLVLFTFTSIYLLYHLRSKYITGPIPDIVKKRFKTTKQQNKHHPNDNNNNTNNTNNNTNQHSLQNRVILITGANAGIGKEATKLLVQAGATVIMACRNERKAKEAMKEIIHEIEKEEEEEQEGQNEKNNVVVQLLEYLSALFWNIVHYVTCHVFTTPNTTHPSLSSSSLPIPRPPPTAFQKIHDNDNNDEIKPIQERLIFLPMDMSDLSSIHNAYSIFKGMNLPLHVLINNAGIMMGDKHYVTVTHDNTSNNKATTTATPTTQYELELMMLSNHLGHFLLTNLLLPHLQQQIQPSSSPTTTTTTTTTNTSSLNNYDPNYDARIIIVTSSTYKLASNGLDINDLNCHSKPYTMFQQYAQSKLANILTGRELARRESKRQQQQILQLSSPSSSLESSYQSNPTTFPGVAVHMVHPGLVRTSITNSMPWYLKYPNVLFSFILKTLQKDPESGAYTIVHCATAEELRNVGCCCSSSCVENGSGSMLMNNRLNGQYWVNSQIQNLNEYALDEKTAELLWDLSSKMVGLTE